MTKKPANEISRQASLWAVRQDRGLSVGEERELQAWCEADPRHRGAFVRALAIWRLGTEAQVEEGRGFLRPIHPPRRALLLGGGALATACVTGGAVLLTAGRGDYRTGLGETRRVSLDDGVRVVINGDSRLSTWLSPMSRSAMLREGEAWFDVSAGAARPFGLKVGTVSISVAAASLVVRRLAASVDVAVLAGGVQVSEGARRLNLGAGQRLLAAAGRELAPRALGMEAFERGMAWRDGLIVLDGETLTQAVAQFNRYNSVKLVVGDPSLSGERMVGRFNMNDAAGFARAVSRILSVPMSVGRDRIVLG